jgi:hypothetical protein
LFGELAVDGFFLEYDGARSGGFAPLRFVPRGDKRVVLGLVTSKRAALETRDELKRRIDRAANYVPVDQLCLSPQCGFSSTVDGNALTIDEQNAKLRLVVDTAREVWGPSPCRGAPAETLPARHQPQRGAASTRVTPTRRRRTLEPRRLPELQSRGRYRFHFDFRN